MLAALVFDLVDNSKGLFGGPLLLTPLAELPGPQLKITERTNRYSADLSILRSWSSSERALTLVQSCTKAKTLILGRREYMAKQD